MRAPLAARREQAGGSGTGTQACYMFLDIKRKIFQYMHHIPA